MNINYFTLGLMTSQIQRDKRNLAVRNRRFENARKALRNPAR